jgi:hypothetical protein
MTKNILYPQLHKSDNYHEEFTDNHRWLIYLYEKSCEFCADITKKIIPKYLWDLLRNNQKKNIFLILILSITFFSCTDKIEIELDSTYERLVVEGHITTDTMAHWVRLIKSKDFYEANESPAISNAIVTLYDGSQLIGLTENIEKPGYYETAPDFFGINGKTYKLNIALPEEVAGKKVYSSACELHQASPIDSIRVEYNEDWEIYEVQIFAWEPPTTDFYKFLILKNGKMVTDTITEVFISDDRFFNGNYTYGIMAGILDPDRPDEAPLPGDTITLVLANISEDYYNFILQLQDQTFQYRNPLFSGPPANVLTNIEGGTGFFAAYGTSYSSVIIE